jgi:hypothetical protein
MLVGFEAATVGKLPVGLSPSHRHQMQAARLLAGCRTDAVEPRKRRIDRAAPKGEILTHEKGTLEPNGDYIAFLARPAGHRFYKPTD